MRGPLVVHALAGSLRCAGCGRAGSRLCGSCDALEPGASDDLIWAWPYGGAPRSLVLAAKLRGDRAAAAALGDGVWRAWAGQAGAADVVTWVPGRPKDTRRRGFDHAHAIAVRVAELAGLPLRALIERELANPDQTSLSGDQRRHNLEGVFVARIAVPRCLVIDDVVTTGATAQACIGVLQAAGATRVLVAAACGPRGPLAA